MQTRYRAAATALLLTATAGMAATGGAAQASGSHHTGAGASNKLVITIKSKAGAVKLSDDKFRPGNTIFKVKNADGKAARGLIQVLRLKDGYTLGDAFADFGAAFVETPTPESIAAINRIDDNVVFYGGMPTPKKQGGPAKKWAVKIDKVGTYYAINLDSGAPPTTFKAKGDKQKRSLPAQDGWVNAVTGPGGVGNDFKAGKHNAASGWMSTTNKALEPHFVDLAQVKKGTTDADISHAFDGTGPDPTVKGGGKSSTGLISPGHRFLWSYDLPKGRYAALCFWPSKTDGMPHALMGMHAVFNLG
jgi:hypothetical protein